MGKHLRLLLSGRLLLLRWLGFATLVRLVHPVDQAIIAHLVGWVGQAILVHLVPDVHEDPRARARALTDHWLLEIMLQDRSSRPRQSATTTPQDLRS